MVLVSGVPLALKIDLLESEGVGTFSDDLVQVGGDGGCVGFKSPLNLVLECLSVPICPWESVRTTSAGVSRIEGADACGECLFCLASNAVKVGNTFVVLEGRVRSAIVGELMRGLSQVIWSTRERKDVNLTN